MNWKVRFKNKTWLAAFVALVVSFGYQLLAMFDVVPPVTEGTVMQAVNIILMVLTGMGVLIDPTTTGITDSARAMLYDEPNGEK